MRRGSRRSRALRKATFCSASTYRLVDESHLGRWIYQSQVRFGDGRIYLLRVVVAEEEQPPVIITVYRTSKIEKYWSAE
jgi:hypothetical protein